MLGRIAGIVLVGGLVASLAGCGKAGTLPTGAMAASSAGQVGAQAWLPGTGGGNGTCAKPNRPLNSGNSPRAGSEDVNAKAWLPGTGGGNGTCKPNRPLN